MRGKIRVVTFLIVSLGVALILRIVEIFIFGTGIIVGSIYCNVWVSILLYLIVSCAIVFIALKIRAFKKGILQAVITGILPALIFLFLIYAGNYVLVWIICFVALAAFVIYSIISAGKRYERLRRNPRNAGRRVSRKKVYSKAYSDIFVGFAVCMALICIFEVIAVTFVGNANVDCKNRKESYNSYKSEISVLTQSNYASLSDDSKVKALQSLIDAESAYLGAPQFTVSFSAEEGAADCLRDGAKIILGSKFKDDAKSCVTLVLTSLYQYTIRAMRYDSAYDNSKIRIIDGVKNYTSEDDLQSKASGLAVKSAAIVFG